MGRFGEIERIRGTCPKCGGKLGWGVFVDTWDAYEKPIDVCVDPVCRKCQIRWMAVDDLKSEAKVGRSKK